LLLTMVLAVVLLPCSLPLAADIELPQRTELLRLRRSSIITLAPNLAELVFAAGPATASLQRGI
jgi:hypothetical protein